MRRATTGALLAGLLLLVTACAGELPEPVPDAPPAAAPPAVTGEQVEAVLEEVAATLTAADEARSVDAVERRMGGPAKATRNAEYVLEAAGAESAVTAIPTGAQTVVAPVVDGWPRVLMVVTEPPADLQAPLLVTLVQGSPREQFRLWSWTRLFPGVQMPPTAQPEIGSEQLAAEDDSLTVAPGDVVTGYVDLLNNGTQSSFWEAFEEDPLREGIVQARNAYRELAAENGAMTETYTPAETGPYALRTADGGALVVGAFRTTTTITLDDSTLTIGDQTSAFLGGTTELSSLLRISWMSMATFYVPPAGSDEQVRMLGAEHGRVSAEGS